MHESISITAPFSHAWERFKENIWFLVGVQLIIILVSIIETMINDISKEEVSWLWVVLAFFFLGVKTYLSMGYLRLCLKCNDNKSLDFDDIFSDFKLFLKYFLAEIIFGVAVIFGTMIFILPGIYFGVRLMFFGYLVVDKELSATEAISESYAMTNGYFWPLFGFLVMVVLINIIGLLFFVVGVLVTLPITSVATAYIYRELSGEFSSEPEQMQNFSPEV